LQFARKIRFESANCDNSADPRADIDAIYAVLRHAMLVSAHHGKKFVL